MKHATVLAPPGSPYAVDGSDVWFWGDPQDIPELPELISRWLSVTPQPAQAEKKYNPDQPRYPAGDPRGGQWAPQDGADAASAPDQGSVKLVGSVNDFLQRFTTTDPADDTVEQRLETLFAKPGFDVRVDLRSEYGSSRAEISARYRDDDSVQTGNWTLYFERMPDGSIIATDDLLVIYRNDLPAGPGASYWDKEATERFEAMRSEFGWLTEVEFRHQSPNALAAADALMPQLEYVSDTSNDKRFFSQREQSIAAELLTKAEDPDYANKNADARAAVKAAGVESLVASGMNRRDADDVQLAWAGSANDHGNEWQDFLHVEALSRSERQEEFSVGTGAALAIIRANKDEGDALDKRYGASIAYDSIYDRTQAYFREKGIGPDDELVLYRGMYFDKFDLTGGDLDAVAVGSPLKVKPRPLSSFSLDADEASSFAVPERAAQLGVVVGVKVPAKAIFSHWSTGFGCMSEQECIVLGEYLIDNPWIVLERLD